MRTLLLALCLAMLAAGLGSCRKQPASGQAAIGKPYVASADRQPYHRPTCEWAKKIPLRNLRGYDTPVEAETDGKRPCQVCRPDSDPNAKNH